MALIALRNHGLLSHWIVDSTLHCMAVVGAHAEAEGEEEGEGEKPEGGSDQQRSQGYLPDSNPPLALIAADVDMDRYRGSVGDSLRSSSILSVQTDCPHPAASVVTSHSSETSRKRNIADVTPCTESELPKKILRTVGGSKENTTAQRNDSVKVLLNLYDLCEVLDVEDDLLSSEKSTQTVFKRRYMHFLCSLPSLASSIRTRNSDLDVQAFRNRSNQWEGDDIHFSYSRDIGSCREGPFDPRRDRKIGPSGCIGDDQHLRDTDYSSAGRGSALTTHVLKVSAISSSEIFHLDFDPKSIRRKQLMGLYG
jgi:hypothetical protein